MNKRYLILLVFSCLTSLAQVLGSANLVTNGDFTLSINPWFRTLDNATGDIALSNTKLRAYISDGGDAYYRFRVEQNGINLVAGTQYTLTFRARSVGTGRSVAALVKAGGNTQYWEELNLTTTMQWFTATFTTDVSDSNSILRVNVGGNNADVVMDDFSIVAVGNPAPSVMIDSPVDEGSITYGETVSIEASASDSNGSVSQVVFRVDGVDHETVTSAPFSSDWTPGVGNYVLTAVATDNEGATTISSPVTVRVGTWFRNTWPGQGHYENGNPLGAGWDHMQNVQDISISPLDPDFRIVLDNMWTHAVTEDGEHYRPLDMPFTGTQGLHVFSVDFSAYDADTYYLLTTSTPWKVKTSDSKEGIWRTTDRGQSWEHIYPLPAGAYEDLSWNKRGKLLLLEDPTPSRSDDIYYGTMTHGIVRSTDGGLNWEQITPEFADRSVRTIAAGSHGSNETVIYAVVGKKMPVHVNGQNVPLDKTNSSSYMAPLDYIARWKFEQNNNDSSGNRYHLSGNTSGWQDSCAQDSYAASFNGSSDSLAIGGLNYSGSSYSAVTVATWVKTTDAMDEIIASFDRSDYWRLGFTGSAPGEGELTWTIRDSGGTVHVLKTNQQIDDGDWHHVAAVFDGGIMRLHVDGAEVATLDTGAATFGSGVTRYGYIGVGSESAVEGDGATGPDNYFEGDLDDVRIYDRALTTEEIAGVYLFYNHKDPVERGSLWRIDISDTGNVNAVTRLFSGIDDISDLEIHPTDPSQGWIIRKSFPGLQKRAGREVHRFTNWGSNMSLLTADLGVAQSFAEIISNPENPDHLVLDCDGPLRGVIRYSLDGGSTWLREDRDVNGYSPSMESWLPRQYHTYGLGLESENYDQNMGNTLTFVPGSPDELIWVSSFNGGLMRSTDKGDTFVTYGTGGPGKMFSQMAVSPADTDHWIIGVGEYGFAITRNGGAYWEGITDENDTLLHDLTFQAKSQPGAGNGFTAPRTAGATVWHPTNPDIVIALWTQVGYILRSTDAGRTWTDTGYNTASGRSDKYVGFWSELDPARVYAGRMRSNDAGVNWTDIGKYVIAMSDSNPDILVGIDRTRSASNSSLEMHISTDGGSSWNSLPDPPKESLQGSSFEWNVVGTRRTWGRQPNELIAIDPHPDHDPSVSSGNRIRILMAGRSGIYEYNAANADGSGSVADWVVNNNGLDPNDHYSAVDPLPWMGFVIFDPRPGFEDVVYAAKTGDDQTISSWADEGNPNHPYAGGDNYEPFYRSFDGGKTWEKMHGSAFPDAPESVFVCGLDVDANGRLFVVSPEGVFVCEKPQEIGIGNQAPVWAEDPFTTSAVNVGDVVGKSNKWRVTDAEGDVLSFAKVAGPAWGSINANGKLTGIPAPSDIGLNTFIISVSDGVNPPVEATFYITVQ